MKGGFERVIIGENETVEKETRIQIWKIPKVNTGAICLY